MRAHWWISGIILLFNLFLVASAAASSGIRASSATPLSASNATASALTAAPRPSATASAPSLVSTRSVTASPAPTNSSTPAPPQHRIGVRVVNGDGEFFDRSTGKRFIPRGTNYIRLERTAPPCVDTGVLYHSTFNVGVYDAARTERALAAMQQDGYNTVRVFLNQLCIVTSDGSFSREYLANVADFLERTKARELFVIITYDDPPVPGYRSKFRHDPDIDWSNRSILTLSGAEVEGLFWTDFIRALIELKAPTDVILAYSLRNEMFYAGNVPPLSLNDGMVATGNGKAYDMAKPQDKQQMMDENLVFWIDHTRARILEADASALVAIGFFVPQAPHPARVGDTRLIRTYPALAESAADFIDLHPYPGQELTLRQYMDNFEMKGRTRKPILMGEYGVTHNAYATAGAAGRALQDWQIESCQYGFDGWLLWTYDTTEDAVFWTGMDEDGAIDRWLAPVHRPDPCAPGTAISLSLGAAPDGARQVLGRLADANGKPLSTTLPVQFSIKPLDGPGVFAAYSLTDVVPADATQAVVGLRVNLECSGCQGAADVALYKASFTQGDDPANRVPDGDLNAGIGRWGHDPATVRVEASDRGGHLLQITASPNQSVMLNSGPFPVVGGSRYTWTMEARVAPESAGSGYWGLFFLDAKGEVGRKKMLLEPGILAAGEARVDADGAFQFGVAGLPAGTFLIEVSYPGDDRHLPGRTALKIEH